MLYRILVVSSLLVGGASLFAVPSHAETSADKAEPVITVDFNKPRSSIVIHRAGAVVLKIIGTTRDTVFVKSASYSIMDRDLSKVPQGTYLPQLLFCPGFSGANNPNAPRFFFSWDEKSKYDHFYTWLQVGSDQTVRVDAQEPMELEHFYLTFSTQDAGYITLDESAGELVGFSCRVPEIEIEVTVQD